ncbi:MAG: phosphomannomutase [Candidatus Omnitrophica bacterium]|nr:phosphomannomutase [Candidatus Omnitrophota bacterium]
MTESRPMLKDRKEILKDIEPIRFGTSGLRDLVSAMTDMECYINARGFIRFLKERGEISAGERIAVGGDRRSSTPRIIAAVVEAVRAEACGAVYTGLVPSPVLANYSLRSGMPSIMVTGSHIPDDRNGIKFTKTTGEVLKSDEADILRNVASAREEEYSKSWDETAFGADGMFREGKELPEASDEAEKMYLKRYLDVFPPDCLKGRKIVLYQHSAVGRDLVAAVFSGLGAEVVPVGRSEEFVPVDTEKISASTADILSRSAREHSPFAIISTDGDSDRPLLADENGHFLPGDKLGALVSMYLEPDFAAIPVSVNPAVVKALAAEGIEVRQTRIGSPYVIAAMNDKLAEDPEAGVVSWESNGGFLTGSDWNIDGKRLPALPTRDAVLPMLAVMLLAAREDKKISEVASSKLPPFYTAAGVVDNKDEGAESYTSEMGREIIRSFSPDKAPVREAEFDVSGQAAVLKAECGERTPELDRELLEIRSRLKKYFSPDKGFGEIKSLNFLDGIRITFVTAEGREEVSHLRPSGNAPEFRNYAAAGSEERAKEIADKRYEIVPEMVADIGAG